jgi:hypothetical protein
MLFQELGLLIIIPKRMMMMREGLIIYRPYTGAAESSGFELTRNCGTSSNFSLYYLHYHHIQGTSKVNSRTVKISDIQIGVSITVTDTIP